MATSWKKTLLLGVLVVTALVAATTSAAAPPQASVRISNPAKMVVNVMVGETMIKVETDMVTVNLDELVQDIQIQTEEGQMTEVRVQDGDVLVVYPDPKDPRIVSVQVVSGAGTTVTPKANPPGFSQPKKVGIKSPPKPSR